MRLDFMDFKKNINGKKVAVLGIGVSNRPLIKSIVNMGANVTACDKMFREEIGCICDEFEDMGVILNLGPDYLDKLDNFDYIFRTPSLRPDLPQIEKAVKNGASLTSEMEEFLKYCPAEVIGVTGSDGKTTTTTLIYEMLKKEGYNVWVGGNIGTPLFDKLDVIKAEDKVVLELSSFQLMTMKISPDIAVVTNLSPNHLDMHKSMDEYIQSKKNIYKYQDAKGMLVLNKDNSITRDMEKEAKGNTVFFSISKSLEKGAFLDGANLVLIENGNKKTICSTDEIKLPGIHNIENLLAASAAISSLCSIKSMRDVATNFMGVEHRIEFVREVNGVKYYNDSIASSPSRAAAGLNAFKQRVILIAGGYDKKIPFDGLAIKGIDKIKLLILMGATADKIENAFIEEMGKQNKRIPIIHAAGLKEAVEAARDKGEEGDIVTLSPACASFDMFKNFEERGNKFKEIVNNL
ncbi:UDP-N-acetylmuramoylalanine--D-glutamate ligase [Oxobacter pfennigii]|uniref:UDP-N-acetylmuramoylalanine--D-glutamate ligase n=1 Tax=Oxobacter pfennigii TaxID=36849 RepID=A0A0P9AEI1_9CLOT|nr:UDP-N-acetylmuramoyl-L-alanine--D-glutamate ligase [Oxobacter pfennigii]KPU43726.1 UDP-N-acetylmuramoylalanine--D-glutamate ligase [Oxobacter pfennigii]